MIEHADERDARVAEHLVREARQPERGGDGGEQDDGALVGEPPVDEAVRRVVAAALASPAVPRAGGRR